MSITTCGKVQRVVRQYVTAETVTVLTVGDLATIRAGMEALQLWPSTVLDVAQVAR